jgi:hypothetical protein
MGEGLVQCSPGMMTGGPPMRSELRKRNTRVTTMTDHLAAIPLLAIQRLRCPKCQTRMMLSRISPGPTGFELRTFDCSNCEHVEKIAITSDPMKSGDVGWLVGELQPPGSL